MTIKYGLQFFFELTDNDGQNFLAGIVYDNFKLFLSKIWHLRFLINVESSYLLLKGCLWGKLYDTDKLK
jgi:hypothetical protein